MVTYIYFVKCPDCEDEHFDFFDDAKAFALGCLSQKPIITQTEVCRNDFGECTDSADLGTVWSWEDIMSESDVEYADAEPTKSIFTKDDLKFIIDGKDPEFDALDNSVDVFETDTVVEHVNDRPAPIESTQKLYGIDNAVVDCGVAKVITHSEDEKPVVCKKPIPEGMTIKELVEEMEENEDTVECTWCNDLFDKSECRYEVDLGWLCSRCEMAIKSRGETLTFREGSYWDFLDEKLNLDIDLSNCIDSSDMEIWGVEQVKPGIYDAVLLKRFDNVDFKNFEDPIQAIHDEMIDIGGLFVFYFDKNGAPILDSWNVELLRELGRCEIGFEDLKYEAALEAQFNKSTAAAKTESLNEDVEFDYDDVEFDYDDLEVTLWGSKRDPETGTTDDHEFSIDYTYSVPSKIVADDIWTLFLTDEDLDTICGGNCENFDDETLWKLFVEKHFDYFVEKYTDKLKDRYEEAAIEAFQEENHGSYDEWYSNYWESFKTSSSLEKLEEAADYRKRLSLCPECGTESFDSETRICMNCGFSTLK